MGGGERDLSKAHVFMSNSKLRKNKNFEIHRGLCRKRMYAKNVDFKYSPINHDFYLPSKLVNVV